MSKEVTRTHKILTQRKSEVTPVDGIGLKIRDLKLSFISDLDLSKQANMGAGLALPEEDAKEISRVTKFRKEDVRRWYKKFMKDYPTGQMEKHNFR